MKKPDAILCADIHIRPDTPRCRVDDFQAAMWRKWEEIISLSQDNDSCPILVGGDLFHKPEWNEDDWLLRRFIKSCWEPNVGEIVVVPGQHDLPNHNIELWQKSILGVLEADETILLLLDGHYPLNTKKIGVWGFPWGIDICSDFFEQHGSKREFKYIAISHQLVIEQNTPDIKFETFSEAKKLLQDNPGYDLILTGDNHKPFVVEYEGRLLVNPGSMMRTTADQIDHKPRVYLWYADENRVEPHYLEIEKGVVSREIADDQKRKDDRKVLMQAFLSSVDTEKEIKLSFEQNMENSLNEDPVKPNVENKIWECVK